MKLTIQTHKLDEEFLGSGSCDRDMYGGKLQWSSLKGLDYLSLIWYQNS